MEKSDSRALYEMKLTTGMAFIYGPEGVRAHAQAIEKDKDKSYRMVVNIVGRVAQGKTSLRRMLVGETFNATEESTVGIEHELIETLGTSPDATNNWAKVDLHKANVEECDLIVGKHVRERLRKQHRVNKVNAEIKSFLKTIVLSYFMMYLYFTLARSQFLSGLPWFPFFEAISLFFSGMILFDTMRDGFGLGIGSLCLVLYADYLLRTEAFKSTVPSTAIEWIGFALKAFLHIGAIHSVMALSMGLSMAMGFSYALSVMEPPWNDCYLGHNPLLNMHLHVFVITALASIWSIRHVKLIGGIFTAAVFLAAVADISYTYCFLSGIGGGFAHAIFIKTGFSMYIRFGNKILKMIADDRRNRRLICYVLGLLPGVFIVYILDWNYPVRWPLYIVCGIVVPVFVETCHYLLEGQTDAAPKASIKNATKVLNSESEASMKFVIRDFAGHRLYHSVHHIYMMGHCVYLICFNFVEAKRDFRVSFADILYWLQAILVHARFPHVRAFIVGTHRDDHSLSREDIERISDEITDQLPRQFHNMVVWHDNGRAVFPVENSSRNDKDLDHLLLRQKLYRLADGNVKPEYPIKFLYFYRVINQCREEGKLIESLDTIAPFCEANDCLFTKPGELEDVLAYFHECGEIIYNSYDNNQNQLVVMDPKALITIMTSLLRAPPRSQRKPEFMVAWQTVAELGIASKRLLYHIIEANPLIGNAVSTKTVVALLEYLDLVCKLDLGVDGLDALGEKCYLITPLIKDTLPYPQNYWNDICTDTIVYIDFGPVVPKFVFTRLLCQCTAESHIDIGTDGRYHLNVSTSKALFAFRDSHSYKIELLDIADNLSPGQQLLKITVRGSDQHGCLDIAQRVCRKVCNIVERDFRKCRFKVGVMCPFEGPHDYCQYEERHIFTLFENIKPEGVAQMDCRSRVTLPIMKEFWCRGHAFQFNLGQVIVDRRDPLQDGDQLIPHNALWDVNVLDLPPHLFSEICDDLNETGSWSDLAEKMGRSRTEIDYLRFRSPRDPCDALLQTWGATSGSATVSRLVELLNRMDRADVSRRIENYIQRR